MNKLIIVGNGFDLSHGLPTSYMHFINDFWKMLPSRYNDELIKRIVHVEESNDGYLKYGEKEITCYKDLQERMVKYAEEYNCSLSTTMDRMNLLPDRKTIFKFNSEFFKIITVEAIENWVDIENIYYEILKDLVTKNNISKHKYSDSIFRLNQEFKDVKEILEEYLFREIISKYDFSSVTTESEKILNLFELSPQYLRNRKDSSIFNEFPTQDYERLMEFDDLLIKLDEQNVDVSISNSYEWPQNLFLDFNYTPTVSAYVNFINNSRQTKYGRATHIQIHGKIHSIENNLNFGFGDEMDDEYKLIEKTNNNEYLQNIKSFQYLNTANYRKLLNWVETKEFQVYIFGHSCGLSDRTLLNTIFENNNCRSIKLFYHQKESSDNFIEIMQNISRHFNKKGFMRSKIVDKTISISLPQQIRFNSK